MPPEKKSFVNVDELMPQVSLEQAATFYGLQLPELKRIGVETRTACFLLCGKTQETGDRALALQLDDPAKQILVSVVTTDPVANITTHGGV